MRNWQERYARLIPVNWDVLPGRTYEERLAWMQRDEPKVKGGDDFIKQLRDPNFQNKKAPAAGLWILNDFRGLTAMLEALEKEQDLTTALNIAEPILFLSFEAADVHFHKILKKPNVTPNAKRAIELILKKSNLFEEPEEV